MHQSRLPVCHHKYKEIQTQIQQIAETKYLNLLRQINKKTYLMINTFTKKVYCECIKYGQCKQMHHRVATEKQLVLTSLLAVRES